MGEHRWLTVVSPDDPDGVELLLEPDEHPAAQAVQGGAGRGRHPVHVVRASTTCRPSTTGCAAWVCTSPSRPSTMGPVTTAVLDDTCGNLIQIVHPPGSSSRRPRYPRRVHACPRPLHRCPQVRLADVEEPGHDVVGAVALPDLRPSLVGTEALALRPGDGVAVPERSRVGLASSPNASSPSADLPQRGLRRRAGMVGDEAGDAPAVAAPEDEPGPVERVEPDPGDDGE